MKQNKTKQLTILLGVIFLISFASAIDIYAGETISLELEKPFAYWSVVGNSSPVYLDIIQNGNNVQITFNKYMKDDSFELVFFDIEKETITIYQSSGGGGTRTITKYVNNTIEVPNYINEYVNNGTTEIKEIEKEIIINEYKIPLIGYILIIIGVVALIIWVAKLFKVDRGPIE